MKSFAKNRFRKAKTREENQVETVLLVGFLTAFPLFVLVYVTTSLSSFLNSLGYPNVVIGIVTFILVLHALSSFILAGLFRFSIQQVKLLGKYAFVLDGGFSMGFAGYNFALGQIAQGIIRDPNSPAIPLIGGMNLLLIAFVWLLRKLVGNRVAPWFRIDHAGDKTAV